MIAGSTSSEIECKKRLFDDENENDEILIKKQKILSSRYQTEIPTQPFVVLTSHKNQRFYLLLKDLDESFQWNQNGPTKKSLLKVSVDEMIEKNIRQELDQITKSIDEPLENFCEQNLQILNDEIDDALWVEKFAPKAFCDLLSDIGINRTLLEWLNLWKYLVFKKEISHFRTLQNRYQQQTNEKGYMKTKRALPTDIQFELDPHKRPQQKIVLLCGSPGAGKTTLAHVVARHAGYNVIEMNASNDRSVEAFRSRLETATQMQEFLNKDCRPNCLVIDEIDGAPATSVQLLVELISRAPIDQEQAAGKTKRNNTFVLLRPVICICNDLYTPALKPLRQVALILNFPAIDQTALAKRLFSISEQLNIQTDLNTLNLLCTKASCDIRSCLHFMQFVSNQEKRTLTKAVVEKSTVLGVKDSQKNMFEVWNEILQVPPSKKQQLTLQLDDPLKRSGKVSLSRRLDLLNLISSLGSYDRLYDGLFESYLLLNFHDPKLTSINYANSWLLFYDMINSEMLHQQNYSFWRFAGFPGLAFHLLFVSNRTFQIQYPHKDLETKNQLRTNKTTIDTMLAELSPNIRQFVVPNSFILEVLPFFMEILQPRLRQTNIALFTNKELKDFKVLVDTMIDFNLSFIQQRAATGENLLILEPPIEKVSYFSDGTEKRSLSFGTRQMILKELVKERVKRNVRTRSERHEMPTIVQRKATTAVNSPRKAPGVVVQLQPKPIGPVSNNVSRDFFAKFKLGPKKNPTNEEIETIVKPEEKKSLISFVYNEGFSDAVRCRIKIQDFL